MNKKIRKIVTATLLTILFAFSGMPVLAHEAVDLTRTDCQLTIAMKYGGKPVAGGELTLYRVGDVVEDDGNFGFAWRSELHCTVSMDTIESEGAAAEVLRCVQRQKLTGTTVAIGGNGVADFRNLGVGLYLVEQKTAADGYTASKPFLISLPRWEDSRYNYTVNASAKAELQKTPTPPETPGKPPEPRLPYTGQLSWPVPVLMALGTTLLLVGAVLRRKKKDA